MTRRGIARIVAATLVALAIAAVAFMLRFNGLGGTLGGFDNDHFVHLLRTDMLRHGEQPLRDFADAELRGAWPSLGYELSVWAQQAWGPTLLAEAYLTVGGLALAAAGVFLLALHLSQRWLVALLAAGCVVVSHPKLYNYEKVLVLLIAVALVRLWIASPSWPRVAALSVWTAVAALIRHDFAIYVAIAAVAALVVHGPASIPGRLRRVAGYGALTLLLLVPSMVWVQRYQGLTVYAQRALDSIRGESARTALGRPAIDLEAGLERENLIAATYYAFWLIAAAGAVAVVLRVLRPASDPAAMATGIALLACACVVNVFFLRGNLLARFGDAIVPTVLLAAWTVQAVGGAVGANVRPRRETGTRAPAWTAALTMVPRLGMGVALVAMFVAGDVWSEVKAAGLTESWAWTQKRYLAAYDSLADMPPAVWGDRAVHGTLSASRYLADCTAPTDRVLLATYAPEIPVFARRLFAGGQGTFGLTFYESEVQQHEAVARLQRQSVPVVIGSYDDLDGEFVADYPHVHRYVVAHYREAGSIDVGGRPRFRVFVANDREASGVDPVSRLPCFK